MADYKLGIDLGGTKIEGIVLQPDGTEVYRTRIPTEQEKGYQHILANIQKLCRELESHTGGQTYTLGLGTPGSVSSTTGLMKNSNTTCLNGKPLKADLEAMLGRPIGLENDANCFAMAEAMLGAGKGKRVVFGVIMGTGCGGGIVVDGQMLSGLQHVAGEWGHMTINYDNGPKAFTGKRGAIEAYISGSGLEARWQEQHGDHRSLKTIVEQYRQHDPQAEAFMQQLFMHFGIAMANLIAVLDPDIIVLGGGVSNIDELYTEGLRQTEEYVFNDRLQTPIVKNHCGDSAGVFGAAFIGV